MKLFQFLILVLIISCQTDSEFLFWIDKNTNDRSDFLYMAESTKVEPIKPDSLRKLLTNDEVMETRVLESNLYIAGDTTILSPPEFKNFGELDETENYILRVIFRNGKDTIGRDYQFILRTYDKDSKIIDSYVLASWVKRIDEYCFGKIDKQLRINKTCDNGKTIVKYRINNSGYFELKNK